MRYTLQLERAARLKAESQCEQAVLARAAAEKRAADAEAALEEERRSWTSAAASMLATGTDSADAHRTVFERVLPFSAADAVTSQSLTPVLGSGESARASTESANVGTPDPDPELESSAHTVNKGEAVMRVPVSVGERTESLLERAAGKLIFALWEDLSSKELTAVLQ